MQSWDINGNKASPGPFNILVANNLSSTAKNLPSALASLYNNIQEGGFLMLEELTGTDVTHLSPTSCVKAQKRTDILSAYL